MDSSTARERARQAAARNTPKRGASLSGRQGRSESQGNQITSYNEDTSGWKLSPATVMVICLFYIGSVVLLHIFGKVKGAGVASPSQGAGPTPDEPAGDL